MYLLLYVNKRYHLSGGVLKFMSQSLSVQGEVDSSLCPLLFLHPSTPHDIPILEWAVQSEGLPLQQAVSSHLATPPSATGSKYVTMATAKNKGETVGNESR